MHPNELRRYKQALAEAAARPAGTAAWLEPDRWKEYMGKEVREKLYAAFSDGELLEILRDAARRLGRNPSKKEVFCVYRVFLIERFGNWPRALVAAGLKQPRRQRREANRRRERETRRPRKQETREGGTT